eukprot:9235827-Pyramimonas_sp.AAC.1
MCIPSTRRPRGPSDGSQRVLAPLVALVPRGEDVEPALQEGKHCDFMASEGGFQCGQKNFDASH